MATLEDVIARRIAPGQRLEALREALGVGERLRRVRARPTPLTLAFQNTALITPDVAYKGRSRRRNLGALIRNLRTLACDVVGLCEVFNELEQAELLGALRDVYPHAQRGPGGFVQSSGLLVLSRHPIRHARTIVYRQAVGIDELSRKGAVHCHIVANGQPLDVFVTHTQDIEVQDGASALAWQLHHLGQFVASRSSAAQPAFVMGDLNWPDRPAARFRRNVLAQLGNPVDLWRALHPTDAGATFETPNSFYKSPVKATEANRLDYMLHPTGGLRVPLSERMERLELKSGDAFLSDHFGLLGGIAETLSLGPDMSRPLRHVTVRIVRFTCFANTWGAGSDEVSFGLRLFSSSGRSKARRSKRADNVKQPTRPVPVKGQPKPRPFSAVKSVPVSIPAAQLDAPTGRVRIEVDGTEHDTLSADDNLGKVQLVLSLAELQLHRGRPIERVMPLLTGDGGEYAVTVEITAE